MARTVLLAMLGLTAAVNAQYGYGYGYSVSTSSHADGYGYAVTSSSHAGGYDQPAPSTLPLLNPEYAFANKS